MHLLMSVASPTGLAFGACDVFLMQRHRSSCALHDVVTEANNKQQQLLELLYSRWATSLAIAPSFHAEQNIVYPRGEVLIC